MSPLYIPDPIPTPHETYLTGELEEVVDKYYEAKELAYVLYLMLTEIEGNGYTKEMPLLLKMCEEYEPNWAQNNSYEMLLERLETLKETARESKD